MRTLLLATLLLAPAASFAAPFSDVPDTHSNVDAIAFMKAEGIVEGYADGRFKPDATINRAEFMKIIHKTNLMIISEEQERHPNGPFWEDSMCIAIFGDAEMRLPVTDVDESAWYAGAVCHGLSQGLIDGYPDRTFRPANDINFAEAAKIVANAEGLMVAWPEPSDPWYYKYVISLAVENAIPTSVSSFDSPLTRGELAEMIYRLETNNRGKPSRKYEGLAGDGTLTYAHTGMYMTFPDTWRVSYEMEGEILRAGVTFENNTYVRSGYIEIRNPETCPDVPSRTDGVVQTVTLGGHAFTAYELNDGAAGTTYNTITFFSQVNPRLCIVIAKAIGVLNADPLNDMGAYTPAHAAIRDAELKAARDVMGNAIKTLVIK